MENGSIELKEVLPEVFADKNATHGESDVWLADSVLFERGKRYVVSSASGGGKSSLCSFLYGSRNDYNGSILLNGTDIRTFKESQWDDIRRNALAWLPQDMRLFPKLTVLENVMLKASMTRYKSEAEVCRMLALVGLDGYAGRQAASLSIGQQQRVAAVRALCQPFSFILLDEPVSHLDDVSNKAMSRLILEEVSKQGAGVIVTSVGNNPFINTDKVLKL